MIYFCIPEKDKENHKKGIDYLKKKALLENLNRRKCQKKNRELSEGFFSEGIENFKDSL